MTLQRLGTWNKKRKHFVFKLILDALYVGGTLFPLSELHDNDISSAQVYNDVAFHFGSDWGPEPDVDYSDGRLTENSNNGR